MKRNISILLFCLYAVLISFQGFAQIKIIKGGSPYGDVLYNFDGTAPRSGTNQCSTVLFNWDGEAIRKGSSKYSDVLFDFDGTSFRQGDSKYGKVLFNWDGRSGRRKASLLISDAQRLMSTVLPVWSK